MKVYLLEHAYCESKSIRLYEYAIEAEDDNFLKYMHGAWETMKESIKRGLQDTGVLPGGLNVAKKAKKLV